ncbi:hypothetical protein [Paraburkholderia sp. BL10I2N1]|uniref:hypothetical protein n=1 Tax=Paraburkholderia sp. BL10I2N1 TaxID=1938796 RepID=UPI00105D3976|nr:hypothetical protein [Paraburkholderia sp. BL10I2N1]TDN70961.1 hypothetical protein B0G77_4483 [Paraburkholderia sp. BL10I2N1]
MSTNPKYQETFSRINSATGTMTLMTEVDVATGEDVRVLRLGAAEDGKALVLVDFDERKAGIHREIRSEITVRDLIAAIRTYGAELSGERHNL